MSAAVGRVANVAAGTRPVDGLLGGSTEIGCGEPGDGKAKAMAEIVGSSVRRLAVDGGPEIDLAAGPPAAETTVSVGR